MVFQTEKMAVKKVGPYNGPAFLSAFMEAAAAAGTAAASTVTAAATAVVDTAAQGSHQPKGEAN
jgi:hypothetical protein